MKAIDLYKFITNNKIEWHHQENDGTPDVLIFPNFNELVDFHKILSAGIFDDEGIECRMKDGYLAVWMRPICEYYGVEIEDVFEDMPACS